MNKKKILIIGESCLDVYVYGKCSRLCPEAPVPVLKAVSQTSNGGMAMNVFSNLLQLAKNDDEVDIMTNQNWKDIKKIRYLDDRTNHMFLRLDENDEKYDKLALNYWPDKINFESFNFSCYDAIIVSDYDKGLLSTNDLWTISNKHSLTFLDTKKNLDWWSKKFSFIKINQFEYELSKPNLTWEIEEKLIITKGAAGASYKGHHFPVPQVDIRDSSGAGDTFIAGLVFKYLENYDINESIQFANKCATNVVQKRGVAIVDSEIE